MPPRRVTFARRRADAKPHFGMKSKAIVLHTVRYNDDGLIASLLTEQAGSVDMLVRISRGRRVAVRHTLFQPMAVLDVEWDDHPHASLQRPKTAQTALPLSSLPYDPHKAAIALFLAEALHQAVHHEAATRELFAYTLRSIEWLDTCTKGFANFHLVFLLRLTRFLGFMPNMEGARAGSWFDLRASCFTASQPLHPDFLAPADAALVPRLLRMSYGTMHVFRFSGAERSRLLEQINRYYRLHLPGYPELKSLAVLREMF